jgi:hypothetical protein
MKSIRNSILSGLAFGLFFGLYIAFRYGIQFAVIAGPVSGLAFGIAIYFFVTSKIVKQQTQIENVDENEIILSCGANHFKNREAVGGKLYLLTDKLQFKSHNFNIQNHGLEIPLVQISQTRFFNTLGLIPNGLEILTNDGRIEKFVVSDRKKWSEEIEKNKNRA